MSNTQINITENGTTTLATAGKYCDRNIDVNVNVAGAGTEQQAITDSIIDGTIKEYVNTTVTSVRAYAFCQATQLESVILPNATNIYAYAFDRCTALKRVELTNPGFGGNAFRSCPLEKFVLRGTKVINLANTNTFSQSGIENGTGYVYVLDDLVDSYKTATNWSTYASQIKPISELEE